MLAAACAYMENVPSNEVTSCLLMFQKLQMGGNLVADVFDFSGFGFLACSP